MKNLLLLYGGPNEEREISIASCENIEKYIDRKKFNVIFVLILPNKSWILKNNNKIVHLINENGKGVLLCEDGSKINIDVAFPVLHGVHVEDGQLQGFFETLNIPYVGTKTLGSALCFDKIAAKKIVKSHGINVVDFVEYTHGMSFENACEILNTNELFVKPSGSGSTFGASKASNAEEFDKAITLAKKYDKYVLIEKFIPNVRELFCTVFDGKAYDIYEVTAVIGEWLDYAAKYTDDTKTKKIVHKEMSGGMDKKIKEQALRIFKILRCHNFARLDFLMDQNGTLYFSEVNTIPGMAGKSFMLSALKSEYTLEYVINKMIEDC